MKKLHTLLTAAGIALAVSLPVHAQVKIGVIASSTGAIPFVGIPQKNAVALLPTKMGDLTSNTSCSTTPAIRRRACS
jgi:branched-chain amino acid transport system substrate-binding protein